MELIELPEDYKKCSSGGEAVVRKNNGSYTVGFWYTQGFLDSGFSYLPIVMMTVGQM